MAEKITTTGIDGGTIETEFQSGWSKRDWLRAHRAKFQGKESAAGATEITTTWPVDDQNGGLEPKEISTEVLSGVPPGENVEAHALTITEAAATPGCEPCPVPSS